MFGLFSSEVLWVQPSAITLTISICQVEEQESSFESRDGSLSSSIRRPLTNGPTSCHVIEPTMPHGTCRDKCREDAETGGGSLHPRHTSCSCEEIPNTCTADAADGDEKADAKVYRLIYLGNSCITFDPLVHICVSTFLLGAWETWL